MTSSTWLSTLTPLTSLNTGDVLLFDYTGDGFLGLFSACIKFCTNSNYSHSVIVLKDPTWIDPSLTGLYAWESSYEGTPDPQDGKIKLGVQLIKLEKLVEEYKKHGYVYVRRLKGGDRELFTDEKLKSIHELVYNKPYDLNIKDWIDAFIRYDATPQKTDRFWCSALVGIVLTKLGVLDAGTDWSILRPSDFGSVAQRLNLIGEYSFENEEQL